VIKTPFLKEVFIENFDFDSNVYPFNIPFVKNNNLHFRINRPVIILVGDNGTGKSTILESIAKKCGFNTSSGSYHLYDLDEEKMLLDKHLKLIWDIKVSNGFFLRAESFTNFAKFIDEQAKEFGSFEVYKYYGGKSLNEQSHGESFLSLFASRFNQKGIYILDEPEAALSPTRILSLMSIIKNLTDKGNSQFIIATHSPILMAYPYAQLFYIDDDIIKETTYEKTEHYKISKDFLNNPERYFNYLFDDNGN